MKPQRPEKVFLIINKYAGHGYGAKSVDVIVPFLKQNNCSVVFEFTQHPGHAAELAAGASANGYDLVVAVGGDGTVNEVAQGLIGTDTIMGIIPIGSGNGLARELGISMNLKKSTRSLIEGVNLNIDVCRMNDQRFLCTSGIGFDAMVADKMSKSSTRGFLKYVQLVIQESIFYKAINIKMKIDGVLVEKPVFLITFANASQFGNNAYIAPKASLTDDLIDVVVVKKFSKIWLPVFSVALFARFVPKLPFVTTYKARKIDLEIADTPYFHFDGEPGKLKVPAHITIDSAKIWVKSAK